MALRILIVDDIPQNISSLIEALGNNEISFVTASSGQEALSILAKEENFDLALIDVQMPEMDGYELATLMRGVEKTRLIPIIFITAQSPSHYSEFKGYTIGAIDFIFKPVNIKMLQSKIDVFQMLKTRRLILDEKIEELEKAKKRLEISEKKAIEADLIKSEFLAHMSHEVRTPITSLIGFAELLKPLLKNTPKASEYVEIILKNGKHLLDLVNDVLDLSKVEAEQLELITGPLNLTALIEEVILLLKPLAEKNKVQLIFNSPSSESIWCYADNLRLKQIITNVVGNAIKFSPNGTVSVRFDELTNNQINLLISDTGIGIDPLKVDQLFKPFSQVSDANPERFWQGTGLGLSLSKKLIQKMGGDLFLKESTLGQGSTFAIRIPCCEQSELTNFTKTEKKIFAQDQSALANIKILLADDSPDNRMLIESFLRQYGADIVSAENGKEAIDMVQIHKPHIALLDLKMPVMDGLSATKNLRKDGYSFPIILLTANAMKGERELALRNGATGYVSKPINWDELVSAIQSSLHI